MIILNVSVVVGIIMLLDSLVLVRKIIRHLPHGCSNRHWHIMSGLIVLFVMGYTVFMLFFLDQKINMIVYGILFFSAIYVWLSSFVSLQTTIDLSRIEDLELQTFTDYLTGVYNRRFMYLHLNEELLKAKRYNFELSIILFDLDSFQWLNDEYGIEAGNQVLVEICILVNTHLRDADILSRYSSNAFLIITPNTGINKARLLAERLRTDIETHLFLKGTEKFQSIELNITASFGLAFFRDCNNNLETLIGAANKNLYLAKNDGRNRIAG